VVGNAAIFTVRVSIADHSLPDRAASKPPKATTLLKPSFARYHFHIDTKHHLIKGSPTITKVAPGTTTVVLSLCHSCSFILFFWEHLPSSYCSASNDHGNAPSPTLGWVERQAVVASPPTPYNISYAIASAHQRHGNDAWSVNKEVGV